jgi:hypothetical protein
MSASSPLREEKAAHQAWEESTMAAAAETPAEWVTVPAMEACTEVMTTEREAPPIEGVDHQDSLAAGQWVEDIQEMLQREDTRVSLLLGEADPDLEAIDTEANSRKNLLSVHILTTLQMASRTLQAPETTPKMAAATPATKPETQALTMDRRMTTTAKAHPASHHQWIEGVMRSVVTSEPTETMQATVAKEPMTTTWTPEDAHHMRIESIQEVATTTARCDSETTMDIVVVATEVVTMKEDSIPERTETAREAISREKKRDASTAKSWATSPKCANSPTTGDRGMTIVEVHQEMTTVAAAMLPNHKWECAATIKTISMVEILVKEESLCTETELEIKLNRMK